MRLADEGWTIYPKYPTAPNKAPSFGPKTITNQPPLALSEVSGKLDIGEAWHLAKRARKKLPRQLYHLRLKLFQS
jgi:hypothetical protein